MKKLGKFIIKNRVVIALMTIIVICGILALYFGFKVFWGDTSDNNYGTRLDDIKEVVFTEEMQNNVTDYLKTNTNVSTVTYDIKGKIIYLIIDFNKDYALKNAKSLCTKSLEKFDATILEKYDVQFMLTASTVAESKIYPTMGYKPNESKSISWVNS